MRVLQINKYHHIEGGAERYYLGLSNLLKKKGLEVAHFSMHNPKNEQSNWEKYFVSNISFKSVSPRNGWKILGRMIYSFEAKNKIGKLLDVFRPDIVHIHGIYYHISPSILLEIKKRKIPVVYTLHDYHLLTPNITFFHDGKICEITKKNNFYKAVLHKCVKDSYFASFLAATTLQIHRAFNIYKKNVDYFIAPSLFMKNKTIEYGFDPEQILHLPNFVECSKKKTKSKGDYVLFFGKISEQKGLSLFIELARKLPNINFKIAGSGSDESFFKNKVKSYGLKNIFFLGFLPQNKLQRVISGSSFTIAPSLWYENQPYSILESFTFEKPVVASRIGGIPELVEDGKNGILFEPGNVKECSEKVTRLWANPKLVKKMGIYARQKVKRDFNPEEHYNKLLEIYKKAGSVCG